MANDEGKLRHVVARSQYQDRVHLLALDGDSTMCGGIRAHEIHSGAMIQRLFPTEMPVNCRMCVKSLEMVVRNLIHNLRDPVAMERIYDATIRARLDAPGVPTVPRKH